MDTYKKNETLFPLGMVVITPGAALLLEEYGIDTGNRTLPNLIVIILLFWRVSR